MVRVLHRYRRGHEFQSRSNLNFFFQVSFIICLTLGRTSKVIPPPWHKGVGGFDGTHPLGFCCVSIFRRDFAFGRKPVMCSTRCSIYCGLWCCWGEGGGAVTSRNLGFYQKLVMLCTICACENTVFKQKLLGHLQ